MNRPSSIMRARREFSRRTQGEWEPFDEFADALTQLSDPCEYGMMRAVMIRDMYIMNLHPKHKAIQEMLISHPTDLTLGEAVLLSKVNDFTSNVIDPLYKKKQPAAARKSPKRRYSEQERKTGYRKEECRGTNVDPLDSNFIDLPPLYKPQAEPVEERKAGRLREKYDRIYENVDPLDSNFIDLPPLYKPQAEPVEERKAGRLREKYDRIYENENPFDYIFADLSLYDPKAPAQKPAPPRKSAGPQEPVDERKTGYQREQYDDTYENVNPSDFNFVDLPLYEPKAPSRKPAPPRKSAEPQEPVEERKAGYQREQYDGTYENVDPLDSNFIDLPPLYKPQAEPVEERKAGRLREKYDRIYENENPFDYIFADLSLYDPKAPAQKPAPPRKWAGPQDPVDERKTGYQREQYDDTYENVNPSDFNFVDLPLYEPKAPSRKPAPPRKSAEPQEPVEERKAGYQREQYDGTYENVTSFISNFIDLPLASYEPKAPPRKSAGPQESVEERKTGYQGEEFERKGADSSRDDGENDQAPAEKHLTCHAEYCVCKATERFRAVTLDSIDEEIVIKGVELSFPVPFKKRSEEPPQTNRSSEDGPKTSRSGDPGAYLKLKLL